ncbi:MAG: hypothetical protein KBC96_05530 [Armatimonadetes bacterium]|nr:hypothetical protein [Armatimonadota bacterium]
MGGLGSGDWYRSGTKDTVGSYRAIDVNFLHRQGLLRAGRLFHLSWSRGGEPCGSIGGWAEPGLVMLDYRMRSDDGDGEELRYAVRLTFTPCNFGGHRPWFKCPRCNRRVGKLFGGRMFVCRHCRGLAYDSQNESPWDRALSKCQNIRRKLGGTVSMADSFPDKPKFMHWRTYWRLWEEYMRLEHEDVVLMARRFRLPGY